MRALSAATIFSHLDYVTARDQTAIDEKINYDLAHHFVNRSIWLHLTGSRSDDASAYSDPGRIFRQAVWWAGKFGTDGNSYSTSPSVNFTKLCFGRKMDYLGFAMGLFAVNSLANPGYDLHDYPDNPVDIPFVIKSLNNEVQIIFGILVFKERGRTPSFL